MLERCSETNFQRPQLFNEKYNAIRSRIYVGANLIINMLLKLMMCHLFVFVLSLTLVHPLGWGFSTFPVRDWYEAILLDVQNWVHQIYQLFYLFIIHSMKFIDWFGITDIYLGRLICVEMAPRQFVETLQLKFYLVVLLNNAIATVAAQAINCYNRNHPVVVIILSMAGIFVNIVCYVI